MAADLNASVLRLTVLGRREAALIESMGENGAALAEIHAERCAMLQQILTDYGQALGVDAAVISTGIAIPTDDADSYGDPA